MSVRKTPARTQKAVRSAAPAPKQEARSNLGLGQARALWFEKQGLVEPVKGGVAGVLRRSGWMIAAGSAGPHLSLAARLGRFSRADADRAIAESDGVYEVPALRGTSMLVPEEDAADALRCARRFHDELFEKLKRSCDVTVTEIDRLSEAVLGKLESETLGVDELRQSLPGKIVRSLGEPGRKIGESSTLTFALKRLRVLGKILRVTLEGRLDSTRFVYAMPPASMRVDRSPDDPADPDLHARLARRFFRWAGPAKAQEFAWWAGFRQKEALEGIRRAGLTAASVEGWTDDAWIAEEDLERPAAADLKHSHSNVPMRPIPTFKFLPFRDNFVGMRRALAPLVAVENRGVKVLDWNGKPSPIGQAESLHHHAILSGDRLSGIWEWDPPGKRIVWASLGRLTAVEASALRAEADRVARLIADEIGDLNFYALDNEKNRLARLDAVQRLRSR